MDTQQKKVYRQKLINSVFILMGIWTALFTALMVCGVVYSIIVYQIFWIPIIGGGIMGTIGWIFFGPLLIHRKKIILKDDMIIAHKMPKKHYTLLLSMWTTQGIIYSLSRGTPHSEGRILNLSWKRDWQTIDLTQIRKAGEWVVSLRPSGWSTSDTLSFSRNSIMQNTIVEFLVLTDRYGDHHLVELTNFRNKQQCEIIKHIEERIKVSWIGKRRISGKAQGH